MLHFTHKFKYFWFTEFRSQLNTLEKLVSHIPELVVTDLVKEHLKSAKTTRAILEQQAQQQQDKLLAKQV